MRARDGTTALDGMSFLDDMSALDGNAIRMSALDGAKLGACIAASRKQRRAAVSQLLKDVAARPTPSLRFCGC